MNNINFSEMWWSLQFQLAASAILIFGFVSGLFFHPILFSPKVSEPKIPEFDIEHLTHCNKFFPRINGKYLFWWGSIEKYSLEIDPSGCINCRTSQEASDKILEYFELKRIAKTEFITPAITHLLRSEGKESKI